MQTTAIFPARPRDDRRDPERDPRFVLGRWAFRARRGAARRCRPRWTRRRRWWARAHTCSTSGESRRARARSPVSPDDRNRAHGPADRGRRRRGSTCRSRSTRARPRSPSAALDARARASSTTCRVCATIRRWPGWRRARGATLILGHLRGEPATMQDEPALRRRAARGGRRAGGFGGERARRRACRGAPRGRSRARLRQAPRGQPRAARRARRAARAARAARCWSGPRARASSAR